MPPQRKAKTGLRSGEKRKQHRESCVINSRLFSPHQRIALLVGKQGIQPLELPRLAHNSLQEDAKWSLRRDSSALWEKTLKLRDSDSEITSISNLWEYICRINPLKLCFFKLFGVCVCVCVLVKLVTFSIT